MNHYTLCIVDLNGNESSLIQFRSLVSPGNLESYLEGASDAIRALKKYGDEVGSDTIHKDFVDFFLSGSEVSMISEDMEARVYSYSFYRAEFNLDLGRFERLVNLAIEPNVGAIQLPAIKS